MENLQEFRSKCPQMPNVPEGINVRASRYSFMYVLQWLGPVGLITGWVMDFCDHQADLLRFGKHFDILPHEFPGLEKPY